MNIEYETATFNLGNNEISQVIETESGYYIIKCINTLNREETETNKSKIIDQQKKKVFNEEYYIFVDSLTKNINNELWETVSLFEKDSLSEVDFFDVYEKFIIK